MRILCLILALSFSTPLALAQTSTQNQPVAQPRQTPDANNAATTGGGVRQGADDKALGSGTSTGTAYPNTTGSSNASGTPGVDSSTSNSH